MIALLLSMMLQDAPALGAIGRQALPAAGCAAYLWDNARRRRLVAMATAEPARLRLSLDGRTLDLGRSAGTGAAGFGFPGVAEYRGEGVLAVLDMAAEARADLQGGGVVPAGTLRIERPGRDVLVAPVAGLIGCAGR